MDDGTPEATLGRGDRVVASDIQHLVVADVDAHTSLGGIEFEFSVSDGMDDSLADYAFTFSFWRFCGGFGSLPGRV